MSKNPERAAKLVFVGNCQASALAWAYNHFIAENPSEHAEHFDGRSLSDYSRARIESADAVVIQITDLGDITQFDTLRGRVVRFPYLSGSFIWPYSTTHHVRISDPPLAEFGGFADETGGDQFLNRLFSEGRSSQEVIEAYLTLDIEKSARLDQRYDLLQRTQRARDERAGIETSQYIDRNISRELLFSTRGHPCLGLFLHLAIQTFDKLGVSGSSLSRMDRAMGLSPLEHEFVPIHPKVREHFGLVPPRADGQYLFNMVLRNFEQYIDCYMRMDCDADLLRGARLMRSRDYPSALNCLEMGLRRSEQSPEGWMLLGVALNELGRSDEVLSAAQRAVAVDPTNIKCLFNLALSYLAARDHVAAETTLREALGVHPDFGDGHRALAAILESQNRPSEALRHVRRAMDLLAASNGMRSACARLAAMVGNDTDAAKNL